MLPDGRYEIAPGSTASFSVKHLRVQTVRGRFDPPTGWIELADGRLTAHGTVAAATIRSGNKAREKNLRTVLFAAEDSPFVELRADAAAESTVPATVWVRGRPVPVAIRLEGDERSLRAAFRLDRRAAGLTWPAPVELTGVVGREVSVELGLVLRRA